MAGRPFGLPWTERRVAESQSARPSAGRLAAGGHGPPVATVVIPCRNEERAIEGCLRSILALQPPEGGFEVVVVDGMSTDGTRGILARLAGEDSRVRVIDNPARVTPAAMNLGIRAAAGDFVAIMGAHNRYASDYLVRALEALESTGADNVGGAITCEARGRVQRAIGAVFNHPLAVGGARWHDPTYEGPADTVFGGVFRKSVFSRVGFFDEELVRNQDDEFNLRLTRAGGRIWQTPSVRSWYWPRDSFGSLLAQYQQYGYWKVRVIQKHRLPASVRHLVPGAFVAGLAFGAGLAPWWFPARVALALMVSSYLGAVAIASVGLAARKGWDLSPMLPVAFMCFHFGYGVGFLHGLLDFVVLRRVPPESCTKMTRATGADAE